MTATGIITALIIGAVIGVLGRLFLGSRATKIVRHSPVPVVVVPNAAVAAADV